MTLLEFVRMWGIRLGLWLARRCGWTPVRPCTRPHLPDDSLIAVAQFAVQEVDRALGDSPGPVKAREALRMLQNIMPERGTRDLNLLIELALSTKG